MKQFLNKRDKAPIYHVKIYFVRFLKPEMSQTLAGGDSHQLFRNVYYSSCK